MSVSGFSKFIPIAVFLIVGAILAIGLTRDPKVLPSELIDRPVPAFELPQLNEQGLLTKDAFTGKVTLLNVFGSWCAACVVEHPVLNALTKQDEFQIVGLNWRDKKPTALAWLEYYGDPYDAIIFDADSELAIELGVTGAPETFIIGPNGRVRYKHTGGITGELFISKIGPVIQQIRAEQ